MDTNQGENRAIKRSRSLSFLLLEPGQGAGAPPARGGDDDPISRFKMLAAEIRQQGAPSDASRRKAKRIAQDFLAWKRKRQSEV